MGLIVVDRRIVVELIEKDVAIHDELGSWTIGAKTAGTKKLSKSGIGCNKDIGQDEVVLRVRVDYKAATKLWWTKGKWTDSPIRYAHCS